MTDSQPVPRPEVVAWLTKMAEQYEADVRAGWAMDTTHRDSWVRSAALYRAALADVLECQRREPNLNCAPPGAEP